MKSLNKVNLFIIGAAKCGTTSLYNMLNQNENVLMSTVKEPHFFSNDLTKNLSPEYKKKFPFVDKNNIPINRHKSYIDSISDYKRLWDFDYENIKYFGESSVSYLYSISAPRRILNYNQDAKIIICLRNPFDRSYSHILRDISRGRFKNNLEDEVSNLEKPINWDLDSGYISLSLYSKYINNYLSIFEKNNVLILNFDEFSSIDIMEKKLSKFLKIDFKIKKTIISNKTPYVRNKRLMKLINIMKNSILHNYLPKGLKNFIKKFLLKINYTNYSSSNSQRIKNLLNNYNYIFENEILKLEKLGIKFKFKTWK